MPKYPGIKVQLSGRDGSSMAMLNAVSGAMKHAGVSDEQIEKFKTEAKSGDYDHLIQTCMRWVEVS